MSTFNFCECSDAGGVLPEPVKQQVELQIERLDVPLGVFMRKHWDVVRSEDAGDVSGNLSCVGGDGWWVGIFFHTYSFFSTSTGLALAAENDWNPTVKAAIEMAVNPATMNTQISMGVL